MPDPGWMKGRVATYCYEPQNRVDDREASRNVNEFCHSRVFAGELACGGPCSSYLFAAKQDGQSR